MPRIEEYYMLFKTSETGYNKMVGVFPNAWGKEQFKFIKVGYKSR